MIVTVLWEDARGGQVKGFGPHELLIACLADDLGSPRWRLEKLVASVPKKGKERVHEALVQDRQRLLDRGPLFGVVDRDRVREIWRADQPADCMMGIKERFLKDAPGELRADFPRGER